MIRAVREFIRLRHAVKQAAPRPAEFRWTHLDKIRELKTDEYVSGEYLQKLINASQKKSDLNVIDQYLSDGARTGNLPKAEVRSLLRRLQDKIDQLDMKELLRQARENGRISMSDIFDYFV